MFATAKVTGGKATWLSRSSAGDYAITAAFICLMAVQIARHQMWRDELNVWGIVLASRTLPELFHNLHYEGHPGLWHLLAWCASRFSRNPAMLQVVQACVAAGFILLIALRSPFSRLEKILILLNYFVVFEYAVMSRNYGIGLLIALIYVQLRIAQPDRLVLNATVLGLLANTNVYATILSGALACEAAMDRLVASRWAVLRTVRELAPAALVYLAFLALCAATIKLAADISWRTTDYPFVHAFDPGRLEWVLVQYFGVALVPVRWLGEHPSPFELVIGLALLPIILGIAVWQLRRPWQSLLIFSLTAIGAAAFGQIVYPGSIRHWGIVFVAFLVALWLQRAWRPQHSWAIIALLAIGALHGIIEAGREAIQPYSYAGAAAHWLQSHEPADVALIGTPDTSAAGVAELLGRPMYFLDCSCVDTFLRFNRMRDSYRPEQLPDRLAVALQTIKQRPAVLVTTAPLSPSNLSAISTLHLNAKPIASFAGAFAAEEDYYLYDVGDAAR